MSKSEQSRLLLPGLLAAGLAAVLAWLIWGWQPTQDTGGSDPPQHRQLALAQPPAGGDFTLASADGPLSLADLRGKVVLIYFGYTWCPDICPTNLAIIAYAMKLLEPAERDQVAALFVSVDPERDDLARLTEYAAYFDPAIIGVTGTDAEVAAAAELYGAAYRRTEQEDSAMGYLVDHSSYTYVIGPDGELADSLPHATPPEQVAARVRALLRPDA